MVRVRLALDVSQDEVGAAVGEAAAVEQVGDAGVLELGEDAALVAEARQQVAADAMAHHLDRHVLLELAVVALAEVNRAHAAAADLADDTVGADLFRLRNIRLAQRDRKSTRLNSSH